MAPQSKYRTKPCRSFVAGRCAYGNKCTFLHPPSAPFPPANALRPFARQHVIQWSALLPNSVSPPGVYFMPPQHSVAGAYLPCLSGIGTKGNTTVHPANWKTKPCKHFVRTQGWCPVGETCNFIHDPALSSHAADLIRNGRDRFSRSDDYAKDPRSANNILMGASQSHCWAYIQGMCTNPTCRLFHPEDATSYIAYTPCLRWPDCPDCTYCAFRHHVPTPVPMTVPTPLALPPTRVTMPEMVATIPNHLQPAPSRASLSCDSYEINGTTYFNPQVSVAPLSPNPSMFYDHATTHNGYDSAIYAYSHPSTSFEAFNYVYDQGIYADADWQAHNGSDPHLLEDNVQCSVPVQDGDQPTTFDAPRVTSTQEDEFPYRPPKNQRVGHARRISVLMKKADTLSLTAAT